MSSSQLLAEGPLLPRGTKAINIDPNLASVPAGGDEELFAESNKKRVQLDKDEAGLFGKANQASKLVKKRQDLTKAAAAKKLKVDEEQDNEQKRIPSRLTLSKVTVGMKLFGCVLRVTKEKVVIQLCNQLTCVVTMAEVSDEHHDAVECGRELPSQLKDAVSVHQYVPVVILSLDGFLKASMRASLLNKQQLLQVPNTQRVMLFCSIKSVEDHGAIVNLGLKHLQGFLRFSKDAMSYVVGQAGIEVSFVPQQAINGMVTVQLAHRPNDEVPAPVPSFACLFPGMNIMVSDIVRDDLLDGGSLLTLPIHQSKVQAVTDWLHRNEQERETGQAMVLWVDSVAKTLGVSFLPHLVFRHRTSQAFVPSPVYKVGDLVREAQVERVQSRFGVMLVKDNVSFFAPVSKLMDLGKKHKTEAFLAPALVKEQFGVDSIHDLRVLEINMLEGALLCSLQDSAVLTGGESIDLTPGSVVSARIVKVDPKLGLFVKVAHSCQGLVTLMHVGDSTSSTIDLSKRFHVDQEVKALVLFHNEEKTYFSLKKSLLESTLPMVTEYSTKVVGQVTLGTVIKVDDKFGLLVGLLNRTQGIVPLHDLGEKVAKEMHDLYRIGQVIKVKVVQVQPEVNKMRLSVKTSSATMAEHNSMTDGEDPTLVAGGGTVVNKMENSLLVEFTHNGALLRGMLHKMHLADYPEACDQAFTKLQKGSKLKMLLVLDSSKQLFVLSLKPELISQARLDALPSKLAQVVVGQVYSGVMSNNQDFGSFVHFAGGLMGFVPKANLYDSMSQLGHHPALLSQHATVRVLITAVDRDTNRITCSLKPSAVGGFAQYLSNKLGNHIAELNTMRNNTKPMTCTVTNRVDKVGVTMSIANSAFTGFCALEHCPGGRLPELGANLTLTRVLAVDFETKVMDLSGRQELQTAVWRTATEDGDRSLDIDVELWKPEYCVVSYCGKQGQDRVLALYSLVSFNQSASTSLPIRFGTRMRACGPGNLTVLEPWSQRAAVITANQRQRSDSLGDFPLVSIKLNATVPVKIREIRGCWAKVDLRVDATTIKQALLHSCDVLDHTKTISLDLATTGEDQMAFGDLSIGQVIQAKLVEIAQNKTMYLSLRPSVLASKQDNDEVFSWDDNRLPERNQVYDAWVDEVVADGVLVALSRHMRGMCFATQVTNDLDVLDELFNANDDRVHQVFPTGRPVRVKVLAVDPIKKHVGLSMVWN